MVDDHDRDPHLVRGSDRDGHPALVLELDHLGLVHRPDGPDRLADALGDLLVQPSPLSSLIAAGGMAGLHLHGCRPRADHDDGVAQLTAGRTAALQGRSEYEVAQAPERGGPSCRGFGRPTPVELARQECRRADRPDEHAFRRFDFELQEVRFLIGQPADLVSRRTRGHGRNYPVAEVRTAPYRLVLAPRDRRPRTTTPRRLAIDSARIDPKARSHRLAICSSTIALFVKGGRLDWRPLTAYQVLVCVFAHSVTAPPPSSWCRVARDGLGNRACP